MELGEKIKAARLAKGMTQEELGEMLGVQKSAIAKYESGRVVNIKRSSIKKLADILGISPLDFVYDEEHETIHKKADTVADLVQTLSEDKELLETIKIILSLDKKNRKFIRSLLDALLKEDE